MIRVISLAELRREIKVNVGHDVDIPSALWYLEHKYGIPGNWVTVRGLTV